MATLQPFCKLNAPTFVKFKSMTSTRVTCCVASRPDKDLAGRRIANYQPNMWDYRAIQAQSTNTDHLVLTATLQPFCKLNAPTFVKFKSMTSTRVTCCVASRPDKDLAGRRIANYQPNMWDYRAIQAQSTNTDHLGMTNKSEVEKLKEVVRQILLNETKIVAQLELVDTLQRFGLAYHFHDEIKNVLAYIPIKSAFTSTSYQDLHAAALLFRLFRDNGFQVSQDMFDVFKDDKGHFKECIYKDPQGILSLYEASHLAFEGEEALELARVITTKHLKELKSHVGDPKLKEKIDRALDLPLHWRSPRLDVIWYIEQCEKEGVLDPVLKLAKIELKISQSIYKEELKRMIRWWGDLGVAKRLPFARDRLLECFLFAAGVVSELKLGNYQEEITKLCNLITTLDDFYDIYGSVDELQLFTDAVNKWENNTPKEFTEYLKICYSIIYDTTNETVDTILRKDGRDIQSYLKRAWADLCHSFLVEAKWQSSGYIPTLEEYLDNGSISVSGHVILTYIFNLSMQAEETMHCFENYPNFVRSSSIIFRLCNDLATSSAEIERGDAPSSIVCYMHEHGVHEEVAREGIKRLIYNTWKSLNKEVADCNPLLRPVASAAINLARISHCTYRNGDGIGAPDQEKKNQIKSILFEP